MKDVNVLKNNNVDLEKSLELFGDMQTYDETLNLFLSEIEGKIENLKNYKETSDMANYAILIHGLKSEYRYLGFTEMGELCYKHEIESKANNMYYISDNFEELIRNIKNSIKIALEYLGEDVVVEIKEDIKKDKKLLVVDDSNVIVNFVNNAFHTSFDVIVAHDGAEALGLINNKVDAMLLDLNMPNVNGFAVLEYFRKNNLFDKIPVIVITGVGDEQLVEQAKKYPIKSVLLKPFNERDLKNAVSMILGC